MKAAASVTSESIARCVQISNDRLRGERSAVETYDMAIEKFSPDPATTKLTQIRNEHAESVNDLERNIREMNGIPDQDCGAWGSFAKLVQGTAHLFGDGSAVASLQQGEEKGRSGYESALEGDDLMAPCVDLYANLLLPRIRRHIETLEGLGDSID